MPRGINIGELDRRIDLYNFSETQSSTGEPDRTWTLYKSAFAKVEMLTGSESILTNIPTVVAPVLFTIRYDTNVTEKTRIIYRGIKYNIKSINEIDRKVYMQDPRFNTR